MSENKEPEFGPERPIQLLLLGEMLKRGLQENDWTTAYHLGQRNKRREVSITIGLFQLATTIVIFGSAFIGASGHSNLAWLFMLVAAIAASAIATISIQNVITALSQADTAFTTKIIAMYIYDQAQEVQRVKQSADSEQLELPIKRMQTMQAPPGES